MKLYDLIMQDPDRAKDDAYWRGCKAWLMRELKEQFGGRPAVVRGPRGEEGGQMRGDSARHLGLVEQRLRMFTPWGTPCPLPGAAPSPCKIEAPIFRGSDLDEERRIEVARMRSVIHPDCHERLVTGLGFDSARRLEVPEFFHASAIGSEGEPQGGREEAGEPTEDELARMWRELDDQSARRRRPPTSRLRVLVDGIERAGLAPGREGEANLEVEEGSKLIEVRTAREEGGLTLAVHALSYDDLALTSRPSRFSTDLEGGQKISFSVSPVRQLHEEDGAPVLGVSVVVSYEKAHPLRALQRVQRRLGFYLPRVWRPRRWALAVVLIAIGISSLAWLLVVRERTSRQTKVVRNKEPVTAAPASPSVPPAGAPSATVTPNVTASPPTAAPEPALKADPGVLRGEVRSSASLLKVKNICVEATGDRGVDPAVIDRLNFGLQDGRRWTTAMRDKADAVLSVASGPDGREIYVRLINQEGEILWPRAGGRRGRKYGATEEEAAKVIADLLTDAQELGRGRRGR